MRIIKSVLFEVLDSLRKEKEINVKHESFDYNHYETSHIVALLVKASLVEITQKNPITIKSMNNWKRKKNENIWKDLKNKLPKGTKFYTPVKHALNIVIEWNDDKVVYLSNKKFIKNKL